MMEIWPWVYLGGLTAILLYGSWTHPKHTGDARDFIAFLLGSFAWPMSALMLGLYGMHLLIQKLKTMVKPE